MYLDALGQVSSFCVRRPPQQLLSLDKLVLLRQCQTQALDAIQSIRVFGS